MVLFEDFRTMLRSLVHLALPSNVTPAPALASGQSSSAPTKPRALAPEPTLSPDQAPTLAP
jgi:hypothetical protein